MSKELYKNIPSRLGDLLRDVRSGRIGLPDLQRPFVWQDNKVRNLFDSMIKGYPVGYIMLWESPVEYEDKKSSIGFGEKIFVEPKELVIDGQQRLTALVSAMYGIKIKDKNFKERNIKISYNPLNKEFAVWTPAFENNPEWIPEISNVFLAKADDTVSKLRRGYIKKLNVSREKGELPKLTEVEEDGIEKSVHALLSLEEYQLPTLEISYNASEEDVADIFVRVNSGGQSLNENNFILTLISVYEKDMRDSIDAFCEQSRIPADKTAYNTIMAVEPSNLVRMAVGVGFRRARLRYVYMLLRGKDLATGEVTVETRQENLDKFRAALTMVMNLNNWHAFLNIIADGGYLSNKLIASSNAIVYSYVLYLTAKYDYNMESVKLKKLISRWFYMSAITVYYSGSTESTVEKQFADLRDIHTAEEFEEYINKSISARFTDDYFSISLPLELNSSSAISPAWYGYLAAQNILNIPMLFSTNMLAKYLVPGSSGTKNAVDKHHIFPKNYLTGIGFINDRDRNQMANFTYLDYTTNIDIADKNPSDYVGDFRTILGEEEYLKSCKQHALPENFESMEYMDFLEKRRYLMAGIVKAAYKKLCI